MEPWPLNSPLHALTAFVALAIFLVLSLIIVLVVVLLRR